jgi:hypothetical protein
MPIWIERSGSSTPASNACRNGRRDGIWTLRIRRGIAVRIDVHHADRSIAPQRFEDRIGNRMVAADRERNHVASRSLSK